MRQKNGESKNLLNELEDFVGVEKLFEDEDTKKRLLKIKRRLETSAKELIDLGYFELLPPIRRVMRVLREIGESGD